MKAKGVPTIRLPLRHKIRMWMDATERQWGMCMRDIAATQRGWALAKQSLQAVLELLESPKALDTLYYRPKGYMLVKIEDWNALLDRVQRLENGRA